MKNLKLNSSTELDSLHQQLSAHTGYTSPTDNYRHLKIIFDVIRQYSSFEEAIKFNEILPLPFKAIFLDAWHIPSGDRQSFESIEQLAEVIAQHEYSDLSTADARQLLRKVFTFLGYFTPPKRMQEGLSFLPSEFRSLLLHDPSLRYAYSDTCIWLS